MQFDMATTDYRRTWMYDENDRIKEQVTLMEKIQNKWDFAGYKMPKLIFWNVNAATGGGNIPMKDRNGITCVSGASPSIFTQIMTGKTGVQLMWEALCSARYAPIDSILP